MSAHYNEVLELFTFYSLPFPKLHAQHLTISELMALELRRVPDYFLEQLFLGDVVLPILTLE